jgi:hypothetical protein
MAKSALFMKMCPSGVEQRMSGNSLKYNDEEEAKING